jgi:predicted Fe-S protein YdhL (DUF1289 family)
MSVIANPCIRICYRDSKDVCFGCRRTGEEVGKWSKMTNEEKLTVIDKTYKRTNVAGEMPPGNYLK